MNTTFRFSRAAQASAPRRIAAAALKTVIALAALLPQAASAQHWQLKVGGGLATQYGDSRSVGAYKIGVAYDYEFNQHWTISPGLVFYGKGWKDRDTMVPVVDDNGNPQLDDNGQQAYSLMARSTSANYIEIPVLFNYYHRVGLASYLVFSAGPYAAFGVAGKIKTKGDGERIGSEKLFYDGKTFDEDGARRFDAGLQAFAGYQFATGVTVGLEGDFGMVPFKSGGGRHLVGLISLSYTFH